MGSAYFIFYMNCLVNTHIYTEFWPPKNVAKPHFSKEGGDFFMYFKLAKNCSVFIAIFLFQVREMMPQTRFTGLCVNKN